MENYPIGTIVTVCGDIKRAYVGLVINSDEWVKRANKYNCAFPDNFKKEEHLGIRIFGTKLEKAWSKDKKEFDVLESDRKIILRYISENPASIIKNIPTNRKKHLKDFLKHLNLLIRIGQLTEYMQSVSEDLIALYIHLFGVDDFVFNHQELNYNERHRKYFDSVLSKE